jgi:SulP family sulfate permease
MVILISVALFVSLQVSVFVGVGLSILLYIVRESRDVTIKTAEYEDGHIRSEVAVNPELVSESIVTLHSYGSLFYASAQYFEQQLPHPTEQTRNTVVILNLRGQRDLDTTTVDMLIDYAEKLQTHDCRLMLAEVEPTARETLAKQDQDGLFGSDNVFAVGEQFDRSVLEAQAEAQRWVAARR